MTKQIPYQITIVGQSGKGKTMAFRNMNPKTCAFINMEGKPLPFENKFQKYFMPDTWQECYQNLAECYKDETITEVVFDSFSAYVDSLLKTARETKKGFDTWNMYNEEIGKLLYLIQKYNKDIIVTGHSANVETELGIEERRIAVKGNEWNKAGIESKFTIVLFAEVLRDPMTNKAQYKLIFNSDGKTSAKTPPMFLEENEENIDNDMSAFLERMRTKLSNG